MAINAIKNNQLRKAPGARDGIPNVSQKNVAISNKVRDRLRLTRMLALAPWPPTTQDVLVPEKAKKSATIIRIRLPKKRSTSTVAGLRKDAIVLETRHTGTLTQVSTMTLVRVGRQYLQA